MDFSSTSSGNMTSSFRDYLKLRRPDLLESHHIIVALGRPVKGGKPGLRYSWRTDRGFKSVRKRARGKPFLLVGIPQRPPDFQWNKFLFGVPVLYDVPESIGYPVCCISVSYGPTHQGHWVDQYEVWIPSINVPDEKGWGPPSAGWLLRPASARWSALSGG